MLIGVSNLSFLLRHSQRKKQGACQTEEAVRRMNWSRTPRLDFQPSDWDGGTEVSKLPYGYPAKSSFYLPDLLFAQEGGLLVPHAPLKDDVYILKQVDVT